MRRASVCFALVASALVGGVLAAAAGGRPVQGAPHWQLFPKSNSWNQRVDKLPVAANSGAIVRSIGTGEALHPDFGAGPICRGPTLLSHTAGSKPHHNGH